MFNKEIFEFRNNFLVHQSVESICIFNNSQNSAQVTIAIPTYKRASTLKQAIDSAIGQTKMVNFDIIVVDNDPTRSCETEFLMEEYRNRLNISYYKNASNIGMGGNWNRCIELAKGDYVAYLHDDDLLHPEFLFQCWKVFEKKKNAGGVIVNKVFWNQNSTPIAPEFESINNIKYKRKRLFEFIYGSDCPPTGVVLRKKDIIDVGGFNQEYYPSLDFYFFSSFVLKHNLYKISNNLLIYRIDVNSSKFLEVNINFLKKDKLLLEAIAKHYFIPTFIIDGFLQVQAKAYICGCMLSNEEKKSINISLCGYTKLNPTVALISWFMVKVYIGLLKGSSSVLYLWKSE